MLVELDATVGECVGDADDGATTGLDAISDDPGPLHQELGGLDDVARLGVSVTRIGATSLSFAVAVSVEGAPVADIEIVWVAVDPATRQPVNVPQPVRDWLKSFLA